MFINTNTSTIHFSKTNTHIQYQTLSFFSRHKHEMANLKEKKNSVLTTETCISRVANNAKITKSNTTFHVNLYLSTAFNDTSQVAYS